MIFSSKSILIFEYKLDLKHLGSYLEELDIRFNYAQDFDSFNDKCRSRKYDIIVLSLVDEDEIDTRIDDILADSPNFRTPVIAIFNENNDILSQAVQRQFDFVLFPFNPSQFIARVEQVLRRAVSDNAIHQSLLDLRGVLESIPVGLIQTDTHGQFIMVNREFASMVGMEVKDITKENFFQLCHPDDYFIERKQLDRLLKKEDDKVSYEIRLINNEGITTVCKILATSLWKDNDIFDSYIFIAEKII